MFDFARSIADATVFLSVHRKMPPHSEEARRQENQLLA
jgi:hypothetical protein